MASLEHPFSKSPEQAGLESPESSPEQEPSSEQIAAAIERTNELVAASHAWKAIEAGNEPTIPDGVARDGIIEALSFLKEKYAQSGNALAEKETQLEKVDALIAQLRSRRDRGSRRRAA